MRAGTSTKGPITPVKAWPELMPHTAMATAMASSKLLPAAVKEMLVLVLKVKRNANVSFTKSKSTYSTKTKAAHLKGSAAYFFCIVRCVVLKATLMLTPVNQVL